MKNLHVKFLAILAFTCLSACGTNEDAAVSEAKAVIKTHLKDPETARFQEIHIVKSTETISGSQNIAVCGVVDGKNGFNAYTGGSRFIVRMSIHKDRKALILDSEIDDGTTKTIAEDQDPKKIQSPFELWHWNVYCLDSTHSPTFTGTR